MIHDMKIVRITRRSRALMPRAKPTRATVITLLLSTYLVIFRYPSPIAMSARLRRD